MVRPSIGMEPCLDLGRAGLRFFARFEVLQDGLRAVVVEVLVKVVVDPEDRRIGAGAQAFELAKEELAVLGALADADAELVLAGAHHVVGAAEPARAWSCRP